MSDEVRLWTAAILRNLKQLTAEDALEVAKQVLKRAERRMDEANRNVEVTQ